MINNNNIKILYVDDDKAVIEFVKVLFKKLNINDVTYFFNGKNALDLYKDNKYNFDIVITDMYMPKMNGFELISSIREINPKQICVMATSMDDKENLIKAIEFGINYFIDKPIKPKKFYEVVQKCIDLVKERKEHELSSILLKQYKNVMDEDSIVSKTNSQGIITYVNKKFCEISGYSKEELLGQPQSIIRHPDTSSTVFGLMWYTIKTLKETWIGEIQNRKKNGEPYWVKATIAPIFDSNGNIIEYIGIRTDITQQEKIKQYFEKQLNISSKQFSQALNISKEYERAINESTILTRMDLDGKITYANDKFLQVSGYKKDEIIGKSYSIIRSADEIGKKCQDIWEHLRSGNIWHGKQKNITKTGEDFYVDTYIVPITNENNEILEFMLIQNDITELYNLNQEIEDTQKEVVLTIGAVVEAKSEETGNHVKRVAEYSYLLAKLCGLEESEANLIKMASPMHDIGKIGIPDSILNKPGKLDEQEFEIMKKHSQIGYDMLKSSNRPILKASAIISLEHHERWDGKGYPQNLKEDEIHLYARITTISDVFDALSCDRIYKKAWSLDRILDLFKEERGKHFDPKLVDLFFTNLDRFLEIREIYAD